MTKIRSKVHPPQVSNREKLLLTTTEAAYVLSISRSKLYELFAAGAVVSVKIDGSRLVPMQSIEKYVSTLIEEAA